MQERGVFERAGGHLYRGRRYARRPDRCRQGGRSPIRNIVGPSLGGSAIKPLEVSGIDHVLLLVVDLEKAVAFYEGVAGCSVETRLPRHAMVELCAGTSQLDLVDISAPEGAWARPEVLGGRNVDHVALAIASHDASALRAHLLAHGIAIGEERVEGGRTSFYVRDPSGNTLELRSAPASRD